MNVNKATCIEARHNSMNVWILPCTFLLFRRCTNHLKPSNIVLIGSGLYGIGSRHWAIITYELLNWVKANAVINSRMRRDLISILFYTRCSKLLDLFVIESNHETKQIFEWNRLRCNACYYLNLILCRVTEIFTFIIVTTIHSMQVLMQVVAIFLTTLFYTLHTAMTFI